MFKYGNEPSAAEQHSFNQTQVRSACLVKVEACSLLQSSSATLCIKHSVQVMCWCFWMRITDANDLSVIKWDKKQQLWLWEERCANCWNVIRLFTGISLSWVLCIMKPHHSVWHTEKQQAYKILLDWYYLYLMKMSTVMQTDAGTPHTHTCGQLIINWRSPAVRSLKTTSVEFTAVTDTDLLFSPLKWSEFT